MTNRDLEYIDVRITPGGRIKCVAEELVVDEFDLEIDAGWKAAGAFCEMANDEMARAERLGVQMDRWRASIPFALCAIAIFGYVCFLIGRATA